MYLQGITRKKSLYIFSTDAIFHGPQYFLVQLVESTEAARMGKEAQLQFNQ